MIEEELGRYLEQAGRLSEAVQANRRYRKLADEVFRRDQQQAILELQEGFDNERRVRELELLQRMIRLGHAAMLRPLREHWLAREPDLVVSLVPNFNRVLCESVAGALLTSRKLTCFC